MASSQNASSTLFTRRQIWTSIVHKMAMGVMPSELRQDIVTLLLDTRWYGMTTRNTGPVPGDGKDPRNPPASGACPFMTKLPNEIRRSIFTESLPNKDIVIEPTCGLAVVDDPPSSPKWRRNRTTDLMRICKKVKDEVTEAVYEERTFAIHVHEGFFDGGIEFVNSGRQPLQYATDRNQDRRFTTKIHDSNEFGFSWLKRIHIAVFPGDGSKHTAINTYFMNYALTDLLSIDRGAKKRITLLRIHIRNEHPPPGTKDRSAAIARGSTYWWDAAKDKPRETSIHGISNIQLVLLPFAGLTDVHNVEIVLPPQVYSHEPTRQFVEKLEQHMMSPLGKYSDLIDENIHHQIESARDALEEHVFDLLHGCNGARSKVAPLTEAELEEDEADEAEEHGQERDGGSEYNEDWGEDDANHWDGKEPSRPKKLAKIVEKRRLNEMVLSEESAALAEVMDLIGEIAFEDAKRLLSEHDGNVHAAVNDYLDKGGMLIDPDTDEVDVPKTGDVKKKRKKQKKKNW